MPMLAAAARSAVNAPRPRATGWATYLRLRLAAAAIAGVLLALIVPLASDDPLRGALAIREHGDTIVVSVRDAAADPDAMTNDLRAAGLPANVEVVPVSPSLEGAWVDIVNDNLGGGYNDPRISDVFRQITKRPAELELPADFSTAFTLVVGRPAQPGERYQIALDADVSSAYACLGLAGLTPAEADASIRRQGYEPRWYYERSDIPYTEVLEDVPVDKVIVGAEFDGPTSVIVHTAEPDGAHVHDGGQREAGC
ncbi:MAG TPA: hypothetical protein VIG64_12260 [Actinomycetota bacterium]|jgi:hypothetical protein